MQNQQINSQNVSFKSPGGGIFQWFKMPLNVGFLKNIFNLFKKEKDTPEVDSVGAKKLKPDISLKENTVEVSPALGRKSFFSKVRNVIKTFIKWVFNRTAEPEPIPNSRVIKPSPQYFAIMRGKLRLAKEQHMKFIHQEWNQFNLKTTRTTFLDTSQNRRAAQPTVVEPDLNDLNLNKAQPAPSINKFNENIFSSDAALNEKNTDILLQKKSLESEGPVLTKNTLRNYKALKMSSLDRHFQRLENEIDEEMKDFHAEQASDKIVQAHFDKVRDRKTSEEKLHREIEERKQEESRLIAENTIKAELEKAEEKKRTRQAERKIIEAKLRQIEEKKQIEKDANLEEWYDAEQDLPPREDFTLINSAPNSSFFLLDDLEISHQSFTQQKTNILNVGDNDNDSFAKISLHELPDMQKHCADPVNLKSNNTDANLEEWYDAEQDLPPREDFTLINSAPNSSFFLLDDLEISHQSFTQQKTNILNVGDNDNDSFAKISLHELPDMQKHCADPVNLKSNNTTSFSLN